MLRMLRRILLLCLAFVSPALCQSSPTAEQVLANWRKAVHAETAKHAASAEFHSTEDGIPGTVIFNVFGDSFRYESRREFDDILFTLSSGHPQIAYERDRNGWLREIRGKQLERVMTAWAERRALLFGPTNAASNVVVESTDAGKTLILKSDPKFATPITWYLDAKTFLPAKSVKAGEDSEITTTYSDWRAESGIVVPHKATVEETDKPSYTWELGSLNYSDSLPPSTFAPPQPGPSDATLDEKSAQFPFTMEANHIVFNASVNGHPPIGWILDTGADENVINSARNEQLGIQEYAKTTATGGGNAADYGYARDVSFKGPGWELHNQHVATIDQTGLEHALGVPFGGILGYDWISRFVVEIDYQKKLITLHDPKTWNYKGSGYSVPVVFDNGIPHTNVFVSVPTQPNIPAYMVLDFGAAETMTFTSPFVDRYKLRELAGTNSTVNRPAGMEKQFFAQNNTRGRIEKLQMGGMTLTSIPVNLSANTTGAYASKNFAGTIGESIDSRYHVFLDYTRNRVIFETTAETAKPFPERQTYGMTFLAGGNDLHTFTVAGVRKDSPAEKAGFQKGDVVSSVDGKPASQFKLSELRDWLSHEGEKHELTITRSGESKTIPVTVQLISLDRS